MLSYYNTDPTNLLLPFPRPQDWFEAWVMMDLFEAYCRAASQDDLEES